MRALKVLVPLTVAAAAFAQEAPPPSQQSGGWRHFGSSPSDQAYDVQRQPAPNTSTAAPAPTYQPAPAYGDVTLAAGTFMKVRIDEKLSSNHNQPGDVFTATLSQPLVANGLVVARAGQTIAGRVTEAVDANHSKNGSRLGLELTELTLADGQQVPIRTQLVEYQRGTNDARDAGVVVASSGAGAAIGAIAGGGVGAGIGAIAGAAAGGIGVLVNRNRATEIYPEALLTFRTVDPVTIATDRSAGAFQSVNTPGATQGERQPIERRTAPPGPYYGGYYGGYYGYPYPYYYPYYGPGFYGPYFGAGVVIRTGPRVVVRGRGRR